MPLNMNQQFVDFLNNTPEMLSEFLKIINEFYKIQNEVPQPVKQEEGPKEWKSGETHDLTTVGISNEDLDAISKGYAEAIVKEKAIEYVKGFITGVMISA